MAFLDAKSYLPDDILVKVDRAAMAVSLETRVPFLDHRVAAVAARVPGAMKIDGRGGKAILRDVLANHIPAHLYERPKTGFGIPLGQWLRGPLRDWAEEYLDQGRLERDGWLDPVIVRRCWDDHRSSRRDATSALWAILMFNAWLDRY
jgi:asparagine synthase (glutamine-hydrolysing)